MVIYNIILLTVIMLLSIPCGYILARMARDELIEGKKWFRIIIVVFLFIGILFFIIGEKSIAFTGFFIAISTLISYIKSSNRKWVRKRFK